MGCVGPRRYPHGQSLIELMVSVGIILSALTAIATLVTVSVGGQRQTEESVIAYNLAREGIEVVRMIRDTRFARDDRRGGGCISGCQILRDDYGVHQAIIRMISDRTWRLTYDPNYDFNDGDATVCWNTTNRYYTQTTVGCSSANSPTRYRRYLDIDYLCLNPADNTECLDTSDTCADGCPGWPDHTEFAGWRVTAKVRITKRKGPDKDISLEDYLYAWK